MTIGKVSIWYSGGYGLRYGIRFWLKKRKFGVFNSKDSNGMIKWGIIFMNVNIIRWMK